MPSPSTIRIKLISRGHGSTHWARQLPASGSFSGLCTFCLDRSETHYDWLVVIDDVSRKLGSPPETLACADAHTLLVTTEPSTITKYGTAFCSQFEHILTSQPAGALVHCSRIYSHTGNLWFNGHSYSDLSNKDLAKKTKLLSTVCSTKQQKHTTHNDRFQFSHWLIDQISSMDLYGHGSKYIKNKYDALDPYCYHLAIENYYGPHHWTEKLADSYLSGCFPIYYGCPNLSEYFPEESYLTIDIYNRVEALEKIRSVTGDRTHYQSRLEALMEARRLVMHDYNLMHMIETVVLEKFNPFLKPSYRRLYSRKQMRLRYPAEAIDLIKWRLTRHSH